MKTYRVASLAPGDVAFLPIAANQYTARPVTVAWVREERDGAVRVGWRAEGEDHVLRVPLHLAAVGARLVAATRCGQAPSAVVMNRTSGSKLARRCTAASGRQFPLHGSCAGARPTLQREAQMTVVQKSIGGVQSVGRALDVLEIVARTGGDIALSQLAASAGLPLPTTHRLIRTLVSRGYVRQLASRRYALGYKLIRLGERATQLVGAWSLPTLAQLVNATGETANMAVLDGTMATYVAQVPSQHAMRMFTEVGDRVHRTGPESARRCCRSCPRLRSAASSRAPACRPELPTRSRTSSRCSTTSRSVGTAAT